MPGLQTNCNMDKCVEIFIAREYEENKALEELVQEKTLNLILYIRIGYFKG